MVKLPVTGIWVKGQAIDILGGVDNDEDEDNGVGTVTFANADSNDDDSVGICGLSCYIQALWDRSSRKVVGRS